VNEPGLYLAVRLNNYSMLLILKQIHVRIIAIMCSNHRAFTAYLLEEDGCHCHCQRGLLGAATFVEEELELVATIIDQRTNGAAPWMPINRGIRLRAK